MKKVFVLFLILFHHSFNLIAQANTPHVYNWNEVKNVPVDSVKAISFKKQKLSSLPPELALYNQLVYLDLSFNKLEQLPSFLMQFNHLEKIDLSKNKFDSLPEIILQIPSIKYLILNRNQISFLPETISQLVALSYLDLWDNPLKTFPDAFLMMPQLKQLHLEGILYGPKFQEKWKLALPNLKIFFDTPCDCRE